MQEFQEGTKGEERHVIKETTFYRDMVPSKSFDARDCRTPAL